MVATCIESATALLIIPDHPQKKTGCGFSSLALSSSLPCLPLLLLLYSAGFQQKGSSLYAWSCIRFFPVKKEFFFLPLWFPRGSGSGFLLL